MTFARQRVVARIVVWILLLALYTFFYAAKESMSVWEKALGFISLIVSGCLSVFWAIKDSRDFVLTEDVLTIRRPFLKEQHYNLKSLVSWSEYHYKFFWANTGRRMTLKTERDGIVVLDEDDDNSKQFEEVSDYLNENLAGKYEKGYIKSNKAAS